MSETCTLADIDAALTAGDLAFGETLLKDYLYHKPDDPEAWTLLARYFVDADKPAFAYPVAIAASMCKPDDWKAHGIRGAIETCLQKDGKASLKKAINRLPPDNPKSHRAMLYRLMASAAVGNFDFQGGEHWARKSLEIEDHHQARTALAFAYLHQRRWEDGWREYVHQLGRNTMRVRHNYGIPEWAGEKDAKVLVYGDQGLGDQIAYMSAMPMVPAQINCHPKLANLFRRSFKRSEVYGDMFKSQYDWELTSTHQTSMATAMQWAEMRPRGRYLEPMREKVLQWRGLLASTGQRPRIGIAWRGGMLGSDGWRRRSLSLASLEPMLRLPATWVSLEYRDCTQEISQFEDRTGIRIYDWPWGTQTADYDDTAALVESLDAVVCVPTTAYHLAGGLGKPACVLVHDQPHFHEGISGPSPWWESVHFTRRPAYKDDAAAVRAAADWVYKVAIQERAA